MNQTTLNLIAISIFVITMTSLLGPWLHVSPAVPAIATTTLLALAALDYFGWQGRGGTLLVDWFEQRSSLHRDRVVRHEAGHFLVARLLDIPVTGYALSAWDAWKQGIPGRGGVVFDDRELTAELQRGSLSPVMLERYCKVWMAGIAAEQLVYDTVEGGGDDRQRLYTALSLLKVSTADGTQKERGAILQARTLLQTHWSAYEALVTAMAEKATVEDCDRIISTHLEPQIPKDEP